MAGSIEDYKINWQFMKQCALPRTRLKLEGPARIGRFNVSRRFEIGAFSYMHAGQAFSLSIGRYCSIGQELRVLQPNHPVDWLSTSPFQYQPHSYLQPIEHDYFKDLELRPRNVGHGHNVIGNDVWIGTGVTIVNGVTVGDGCVLGAGSLVTKSVPPYTIMGGNPAQPLRTRFSDEMIARLLELRWWDLHPDLFTGVDFSDIDACVTELERRKADNPAVFEPPCFEGQTLDLS